MVNVGRAGKPSASRGLEPAEGCNRWRRAAELLFEQAGVAAVSNQVKLALFYDAQLDIGAMEV